MGVGRELERPGGVPMGGVVGKPDATPLGVTVRGGRGLKVKLRFWGARDSSAPRADSASGASDEKPVGMGMSPRFTEENCTG